MLPIEQAVREQVNLFDCDKSSVGQFVHAIAQLWGAGNESRFLVSKTLADLLHSASLSDRVAALVSPFLLADPAPDAGGEAVALDSNAGAPYSGHSTTAISISVGCVLRERYVIEARLGTGGSGTVFRALDRYRSLLPDSQQHVALKVLNSGRDCSEQTIKQLRRELHCGQMLSHRNIVNIFELDRDGDIVFFTMELLDGELLGDLMERMRPAAMQPFQAWQIIKQLGAGLDHAHERGIVHGDLTPRNILITRDGELRILDFGAAQEIVPTTSLAWQTGSAPISGKRGYASCELLEGRAADSRDDLYALACICYELLTGAHPFARRPANLARDYGVKATRPAGLTGRQWRTLQAGLSWHRAGRSMSVHTWIQRLTHATSAGKPSITPLRELRAAGAAKPLLQSRAAAAFIAVLLIAGACIAQLRETSAGKANEGASTQAAPEPAKAAATDAAPPSDSPADALVMDARPADTKDAVDRTTQGKQTARQPRSTISVDGYQVSSGDHFVEIRVHRNQLQKTASFAWWTEPATAKQDVDYVHQAKAIQTFPSTRRSTRLYVKLLPESGRVQR